MEKPIPPAYWGLCEAVLETRNILRSLAAAREHSTIPKAQVQAKDELERMKAIVRGRKRCASARRDAWLRDPHQRGQLGREPVAKLTVP